MVAPASSIRRITELDALRGLAVIGIVWMNVYVFALPAQAYYNPIAYAGESTIDRFVWAASFIFVEDKFRTLFAMMFGAGCLILLSKERERSWRKHYARMAVLFVIGIAHSVLLASNDVLRAYAMAGLALPLLAQLSHRALYAVAIGFVAVHVGAGIVALGGAVVDFYNGRTGSDAALFAERNFGVDGPALQFSLEQGREGFGERIARRASSIPSQLWVAAGSLPINLAAMTLGMALWKDRMLAREWRTFRMQRLAAICALIALPALFGLASWVSDAGFPAALVGAASLVLSAPFDTLLGLSYAALAMAFYNASGWITRHLAAVGRLSLTNYLMTSVILAAIFASWGYGLFGEVSRAEALAITLIPIVGMLLWSPVWLERFGQGPFERLWRSAAKLLS
ncbi:DUF418 domain-containing protein [Erythrobacter sp. THAF29]|uniref:DUF418 domain-containing protein n=1 Tax=Erythrobacter sp. THAF29 TaxID=2587851 RepID=UPI0012698511|nr:DUF418 domain-containing protein [Erythrobacter sp. THAF29]QFT76093.1 hypothetical protein FIU90_00925 [Erythrobacter sp. THAF29]